MLAYKNVILETSAKRMSWLKRSLQDITKQGEMQKISTEPVWEHTALI